MKQLPEIPEGFDQLIAVVASDHDSLAAKAGLTFQPVEEEIGTRYEAAVVTGGGLEIVLTQPAFDSELGVQVHTAPGIDIRQAEHQLLSSLDLRQDDLRWRATAIHLNDGDIVSVDPDAADAYFPDAVGVIVDITYADHADLRPLPDVNPAVYSVRMEHGPLVAVPSNLLRWEPILHAESVATAGQFVNFVATLGHHITVRPEEWNVEGGGAGLLLRLVNRFGLREEVAGHAREQLPARWGTMAAALLEAVAPASWDEDEEDPEDP